MNGKQFLKLANGTKVQMDMNGDIAVGQIVSKVERTGRGDAWVNNFVKITEATPESRWAKYLGKPAQEFHFAFVAGII